MANEFKNVVTFVQREIQSAVNMAYEQLSPTIAEAMQKLPWLDRVSFQTSPNYDDNYHYAIDFSCDVDVDLWYAQGGIHNRVCDELRINDGSLYIKNYDDDYDPKCDISDQEVKQFNDALFCIFNQLDRATVGLLFGYANTVTFSKDGIHVSGKLDYDTTRFNWSY
jgi:hypothetical protein